MAEFKRELEKFDPKVAELQKVAEEAKSIVVTDIRDSKQVSLVKEKRIELMRIRTNIEKTGLLLRNDANAFNKAVMVKQKELIAVVEPEEIRLTEIEKEAKEVVEIDKRKELLPERKEKLASIGDGVKVSDEEILEKDDLQFGIYFNNRVEEWNTEQQRKIEEEREKEAEAKALADEEAQMKAKEAQDKIDAENAKIEEEKRKIEAGKLELEHQKEVEAAKKEAEKNARIEAEEKIEADKKVEEERIAKEKADKLAEEKSLAKRTEFKKFLTELGYTEKTKTDFHIKDDGVEVTLYKKVGVFTK